MTRPSKSAMRAEQPSVAMLRACLAALTDALDGRGPHDTIHLDPATLAVAVDSRLDDVDARRSALGAAVPPPDGLFEWGVRRDFVRALPAGPFKRRLGATLAGSRTRRRFEVVLGTSRDPDVRGAFTQFRRRRIRGYAARVVRATCAGER